MADLIKIITAKPEWKSKINDRRIVSKWIKELKNQGANPLYLLIVLDLLKNYQEIKYGDDIEHIWNLDIIGIDINDISIVKECDCGCCVCQDNEYALDSDYEASSDEEIITKCECTPEKLNVKKMEYLMQNISVNASLINKKMKKIFQYAVRDLEKRIPIDYHPGTNKTVINLIHPSMYCYVKGVSETKKKSSDNIIFQWLPTEFERKPTEENPFNVSIKSYINNLDQTEVLMYAQITNILERFAPKFEELLQKMHERKIMKTYQPLDKFQVIIKMANTVLTPENPVFDSSSWHLEGLPYEKIVATGIYYYEMSNIMPSYLQFRTTMADPMSIDYPQNGVQYVKRHYGMKELEMDEKFGYNTETTIELGEIETVEDMCLVFPNFMQHKVSKFELLDKTKSGVRKILVFFLVDPTSRILSTADVKPQQFTMSLEDAMVYRDLLMYQRKYEINNQNSFYERGWSLCEH